MANNPPAKVREVAVPRMADVTSCIVKPTIEGHLELKHPMIQLLHSNGQFTGMSHEDSQQHIHTFLQIVDTFATGRVTKEFVRLTLFPLSLLGNASNWLLAEPANSITTWDDLATKFLTRFFPPAKTARLRREIMSFRQKNGEKLYQAWGRFKGLLRDCPRHHQTNEVLTHTFIESLDAQHKLSLDNYPWEAQIDAMRTEIKKLTTVQAQPQVHAVQQANIFCEVCGEAYTSDVCPANPASIYFLGNAGKGQGNNNQYGNSYNPNWRNHPNFRWSDNQGNQKQNYQPAPVPQAPANSMEEMMNKMMSDMQRMMKDQQKLIADNQNHDLATTGALPSDTDVNPKPCNVVTLRNGRELEEVAPKKTNRVEAEKENIAEEMIERERVVEIPVVKQPQPVVAKPSPPFPQHLARQKEEATC
ncbi:uncharacterized protein LOC132064845 [Lycium ferocissimum]|uniref:uncharacterized protein LOC132064845 n=1 Tax=Lycium ferocissimum TaxID=112874 RepID=UPI0028164517|nr:uncharacterized protein LOC132064845 [Lycium ferocissimum]